MLGFLMMLSRIEFTMVDTSRAVRRKNDFKLRSGQMITERFSPRSLLYDAGLWEGCLYFYLRSLLDCSKEKPADRCFSTAMENKQINVQYVMCDAMKESHVTVFGRAVASEIMQHMCSFL